MRTRRSRGLKQTRRGGKDTAKNRANWEYYWQSTPGYDNYDPMMNYPGRMNKTFFSKNPNELKKLTTTNTYIIQRHGFSCANLEKAKDNKFHFQVADPSLTAYGIYSLLRVQRKPEGFDGTIFVSSLLRTWQTGILEYGRHGPLTIVVSPYIKEKHGIVGDRSNMPLPFEQQMAQMGEFMTFLKGIDNDTAKEIVKHEHVIVYMGQSYVIQAVLGREGKKYIDDLKRKGALTPAESTKPTKTKDDVFIPEISVIPHPSLREYYGAKGFVYFDYWVRKQYPDMKTIFVVSHSNWMQKVIEEYCGVEMTTKIFDENAWKLKITPSVTGNFKFEIMRGVPKPQDSELNFMNRAEEPTCNVVVRPRTMPTALPVRDAPRAPPPQASDEPSEENFAFLSDENASPVSADDALRLAENDIETPYRASEDPFQAHLPVKSVVDEARPRSSFSTEVTTEPIQSRLVSKEPKVDITRSFTELIQMLSDPGIAQGISELIDSPKDFKTKVIQYVYSNPSVETPRGMFSRFTPTKPLYLLQNHYLAFILMYNPYFDTLVKEVESGKMLDFFKITSRPATVSFLRELRKLIDTDADLYQALVSNFKANANQHYSFQAGDKVYAFTLLDLLLYEMLPFTLDNIHLMYPLFIDLVRNGARFSQMIYSDVVTDVPRKMPRSELKPLVEVDQIALKKQWEEATQRLDPTNELSQLNEQFRQAKHRLEDVNAKVRSTRQMQLEEQSKIVDQLEDIKKRYREAVARLDPTQVLAKLRSEYRKKINEGVYDYLHEHLLEYVPLENLPLRMAHNAALKIKDPDEIAISIGGSRGTSWKRSLLRQSSVKAARYRASLYKGKRRTRANRS